MNRSTQIRLNNIVTLPLKGISLVANLLIVPLAINLLGNEGYGVWIVLSGILTWANFLDFGLVHGLRNLLTEKIANKNFLDSKKILSSAYIYLIVIGGLFWLSTSLILLLNKSAVMEYLKHGQGVINVLLILIFSFTVSFILKPFFSVSQAYQKPYINQVVGTTSNVVVLIVLYVLSLSLNSITLDLFAFYYAFIPVVFVLLSSLILFNTKFRKIKPSISSVDVKSAKETFRLGSRFLLIQLMVLVLYSTDNFVIMALFSAEEVVPINSSYKLFSVVLIAGTTLLVPYWSAFTNAYVMQDVVWIRRAIKRILLYVLFSVILIAILVFYSKDLYHLWLGNSVEIASNVTYAQALFVLNSIIIAGLSAFLNGLSLLRIQTYTYVIAAVLNIPLSLFLAVRLDYGPIGVIAGTVLVQIVVVFGLSLATFNGLRKIDQKANV